MLLPLTTFLITSLTPPTISRLEAGHIITEVEPGNTPVHHVACEGIIKAPPSKVWALMTAFDLYARIYPGITKSEIRERKGNTVYGYFVLEFPWPLPHRWTLNETHLDPSRMRFDWQRVDGNVKSYEGTLELYPWGTNETRIVYIAMMDPGLGFVPGWLLDYVSAHVLPAVIRDARSYLTQTSSQP